jgi:hypothetical protein
MNELHDIEDRLRDATHAYADRVEPAPDAWDRITRRTRAASRRRRAIWIGGTSAVAAAALFAGTLLLADDDPTRRVNTPVATTPTTVWSPVRDRNAVVHRMALSENEGELIGTWQDPLDAPIGWADVKRVVSHSDSQGRQHWNIELAAKPPLTTDLEPGLQLAYGLVFDTTGDGVADYVVGIDNDAPKKGPFHVWVTNLKTGKTDENLGPSYGVPIEFEHPDETEPDDQQDPPQMRFWFLSGATTEPPDPNPDFYAWTSVTRDGDVIANDYAPDTGWITAP